MDKPSDEEIAANPERYQTFSNGAIYDHELKHIVRNDGGGSSAITPATSPILHARKNELAAQAALEGMTDAVKGLNPGVVNSYQAWRAVVKHTVETFMKSENLRGQGEVLGRLGQLTGLTSPDAATVDTEFVAAVTRLIEAVERKEKPQIVDAEEVKDV